MWTTARIASLRLGVSMLGLCIAASAQIQDLATTTDGAQTYFSSIYRQKGSSQAGYLKIFRIAEKGLELFKQLTLTQVTSSGDTNFYEAEGTSVSLDGRVLVYIAGRGCFGGSHCLFYIYDDAKLAGASDIDLGPGVPIVSPDGQAYVVDNSQFFPTLTIGNPRGGIPVVLNGYRRIGDGKQALANGPVVLLTSTAGAPGLWRAGQIAPISLQGSATHARLDATADMIVYETKPDALTLQLRSHSVISGRDVLLATSVFSQPYEPNAYFQPSLTADGTCVSYVRNGILFVQRTDGSPARALTSAADGTVVSSVISGQGNVAFAATAAGRLLRIDVASAVETELIAAPPHFEVAGVPVPGGRLDVTVTGLPGSDPALLGANAVAPIVGRSGNTVSLQVPWEATAFSTVQIIAPANPSSLEEVNGIQVEPANPEFFILQAGTDTSVPYALVAHEDFSGVVSPGNPARPGEILHMYFTGLGTVTPNIATGSVTPASPLFRLQTPLECYFQDKAGLVAFNILFAGLAPGTIGVEQVDVQLPMQLGGPGVQMKCSSVYPGGYIVTQFAMLATTTP